MTPVDAFVGSSAYAGVQTFAPHSTFDQHSTNSLDEHDAAHSVPVNDPTTGYLHDVVSTLPLPQHWRPDAHSALLKHAMSTVPASHDAAQTCALVFAFVQQCSPHGQ